MSCPAMIALNRCPGGTPPSSPTAFRNRTDSGSPTFRSRTDSGSPTLRQRMQESGSPTLSRVQESGSPRRPSSPTIKITGKMTVPSIATTCSSPSSASKNFTTFQYPINQVAQRKTVQINPPQVLSIASPVSSNLTVSSNDREQPVASACPVAAANTTPVAAKTGGGKRKLGKGCSLLDWIRLCRTKKGQLGAPGGEKRPVTLAELALHNTEDDAWTAIKGKVYNLTHYIRFHPGGKEDLMKGAGIDCSILFDEVHSYVNVESTLKACYVGPLVASSPNTQRRNSANIKLNAVKLPRKESLTVPKPMIVSDGMNKQAVPRKDSLIADDTTVARKVSLELRMDDQTVPRKNSMAAIACEEPDGLRQVSPESPIRPIVGDMPPKKSSTASLEAAEGSSMRLALPPSRIRRTSEPHPRFHWVQSEKSVIMHIATNSMSLKSSDVVIDVKGRTFEAAIFISDWVFELSIALAHTIVSSQVVINCGRVEISLKKEVQHQQWESIGEFLEGHSRLVHKSKRDVKYHSTVVESIKTVTHDTKLYTLRLPAGSHLNVPIGHHLSVKAQVNGEIVERSYTPVDTLEASKKRNGIPVGQEGETIELMIKLYKDGKMSSFLSNLKEGDTVNVSDPEGTFDAQNRLPPASNILMLAAGSGFTPMVKMIHDFTSAELASAPRHRILSNSEATGESGEEEEQAPELPPLTNKICDCDGGIPNVFPKTAKLIFANKKEKDVMCYEELEHLEKATAGRFSVTHILSNADKAWGGMRGRVSDTLLRAHLPAVNGKNRQSSLVCICGPEPFTQSIVNMLVDLDYPDECIQIFQ